MEEYPSTDSTEKSGNTKQISACKRWCFTYNNYDPNYINDLLDVLKSHSTKYIVGEEIGESGTPHLQGYVEFKKRIRPLSLKINTLIHWEKAKGTLEQNVDYCSKDGHYFCHNIKVKEPIKVLDTALLYPWQLEILEIIKKTPDDRKIYWYWCADGNSGKTTFAKYLAHHYGAVPVEGKKNDILYCAANFDSNIYVFDFERSMEEYISYGGVEKIKNGFYMCSKYESRPVIRNPPHIIIFANFPPNVEALSKDRWVIRELTQKDKQVSYLFEDDMLDMAEKSKAGLAT